MLKASRVTIKDPTEYEPGSSRDLYPGIYSIVVFPNWVLYEGSTIIPMNQIVEIVLDDMSRIDISNLIMEN